MKFLQLFLWFIFASVSTHAISGEVLSKLQGYPEQGGFVWGQTIPLAQVKLGDATAQADEKGLFYIGIPRLAQQTEQLEISVLGVPQHTQKLTITQHEYPTQYIKGVKKKHVTPRSEADMAHIRSDIEKINAARTQPFEMLPYIEKAFSQPVSGTITGVYGSRRFYNGEERSWHKGTDFARKTGTPIAAPQDAVVKLALANSYFNGNLIMLDHGHGMMTLYAHLDRLDVKTGDRVKQGDVIGTVGSTGRSTGPHLHWGLYWGKMALNPMLLFKTPQNLM